jgi:DNA-directed RNA polymerase subunit RPC12/RpoP
LIEEKQMETVCDNCGKKDEELYPYNEEWVCAVCLGKLLEKE